MLSACAGGQEAAIVTVEKYMSMVEAQDVEGIERLVTENWVLMATISVLIRRLSFLKIYSKLVVLPPLPGP